MNTMLTWPETSVENAESDNKYDVPLVSGDFKSWGDSVLAANRRGDGRKTIARFLSKINPTSTCWLWTAGQRQGTGFKTGASYGQFNAGRAWDGRQETVLSHRYAYELTSGRIPAGLQVCHHCDNPVCVNPFHLFLGTAYDNLTDARRKGRLDNTKPRVGKLTPEQRLAIYEHSPWRTGDGVRFAQQYGVTEACISVIRRGRFTRPRPVVLRHAS